MILGGGKVKVLGMIFMIWYKELNSKWQMDWRNLLRVGEMR